MSRLFVAFLALAFSSVIAAAATDDELKQQIVGKWSQQASCGGDVLTFNADGTVVHHRQGGAAADDESGTYQIVGGMLKGTLGPDVTLRIEGDQLFLDVDGKVAETAYRCTS